MQNTFETGAATSQANDLVLSVLNDSSVYETRKHCGFALLQGANHGDHTFKELASNEAKKQRATFGAKFKPQHISEAAKLIQANTLEHCFESIVSTWNGQTISATCRRWWDAVNGNSYFSVRICIPTDSGYATVGIPFQYGYGSHWEHVTKNTLKIMGFPDSLEISFNDNGWSKKRDAYRGIYISSM